MMPENVHWTYSLYKVHIYEKGGKFSPHVDTLHSDNHVATLVVSLPVAFEGGELVVKQQDHEERYNLSDGAPFSMRWAAFYTDCTHEVLEVTDGCRVVLQYDICEEKEDCPVEEMEGAVDEETEDDEEDVIEDIYGYLSGYEVVPTNLRATLNGNSLMHAVTQYLESGGASRGMALLLRHRYSLGSLTLKGVDRFIYETLTASKMF